MKLVRAEVVPFGGELKHAVSNARTTWRARHGVLLRLYDERGNVGQGEASPLPGHSADDAGAARAALDVVVRRAPAFELEQPLYTIAGSITTSAAARFALETAVLDLLGKRRGQPLWALLAPDARTPAAPLPLAALIDMTSLESARRSAESAHARGVRTFKLKVGRSGAWAHELGIAQELRGAFGPELRLRFDANQSFASSEAPARLRALAALDPEFVEEPLGAAELSALGRSASPLALDESLLESGVLERGAALRDAGVVAVVLKPMLLGGFERCRALAERARALGLRVVVSHLFDGPIGLTAAAALALALAEVGDGAAGLDRHAALGDRGPELPGIGRSGVVRWSAPGLGLPLLSGGAA